MEYFQRPKQYASKQDFLFLLEIKKFELTNTIKSL